MAKYYDELGNEIDAYSEEEVEKVKEEVIEEVNANREEEINALTAQLEEKERLLEEFKAQMEKEGDKSKNLIGQRKLLEKKEDEIDLLRQKVNELETKFVQTQNELQETARKQIIDDVLSSMVGGNKEAREKILYQYNEFSNKGNNREEIKEKLENAFLLAMGHKPTPTFNSSVFSSATSGFVRPEEPSGNYTPEDISFGNKLGLTPEDYQKYKPK